MLSKGIVACLLALWLGVGQALGAGDPTLGIFEFVGQWRAPDGKFVDFEDVRDLPESKAPVPDGTSDTETSPTWESLPEAARKALEPFSEEWKKLPERRRAWASHGAEHWVEITPQQRTMWDARRGRWDTLGPAERQRIRERFLTWSRLSSAEREQEMSKKQVGAAREAGADESKTEKLSSAADLRQSFKTERREWVAGLSRQEQRALRDRFKNLSREEKRALFQKLSELPKDERGRVFRERLGTP